VQGWRREKVWPDFMTTAFAEEPRQRIDELELVHAGSPTVECDLVLFPEWKTRLPELMK